MKISRSYLLGLGSGLILSALIAMVVPPVSINFIGDPPVNQETNQENNKEPNSKDEPKSNEDGNEDGNEDSNQDSNQDGSMPGNENPGGQIDDNNLGDIGEQGVFTIPSGSTADKIADLLLTEGWISSKEEFLDLVKERKLASRFRAGSFELTQGMSVEEILEQLIH